jgi:hypothetical protein
MKTLRIAVALTLVPLACGDDTGDGLPSQSMTFTGTTDGSQGESGGGEESSSSGDGDGTSSGAGDGDGDSSSSGDGTTTGDGDGSSGDGDGTSGDGDGSSGDGDGSSGDGDGSSGDGTSGDGTSGDGDGSSGDGTSGDGDGTSGDGDGTSGDGDGSSGDGDGSSGDGDGSSGDGTSGDGDGSSGDGDGSSGDGTSGDGDGTTTSTGDGDGDGGCFNETLSFNGVPPSIMFVLDQSGSMTSTYDHDNNAGTPNVSRWNALHQALTQILNNYDSLAEFGVQLFPTDNNCAVAGAPQVAMAPNNAANILATIPAPTFSPSGLTPSGSGLQAAINYLAPYPATGQKAIIFMADGGTSTTCTGPNTQTQITTMLSTAYNGGVDPSIPTYVVGINASGSTATELDLFAVAGGVPQVQMPGMQFWTDSFETADFSAGSYSQSSPTWTVDNVVAADGVYSVLGSGITGGSTTLTDGFETGDFSANAWGSGGNQPWVVDGMDVSSGSFSAHSGNINDSQTSDLTISVNLATAGQLSFDHRESTEGCCDHLQIIIDGGTPTEYDGQTAWSNDSFLLSAGAHTIIFRYYKDFSISTNSDTVWLDNVTIGTPASSDLDLDVTFAAAGNVWFQHRETTMGGGMTFLIDGAAQQTFNSTAWGDDYFPVGAGNHTLTWRQFGASGSSDEVRLDNIRLEEGGNYGGTSYYDAQDTAQLFAALDQIIGQLVTCDLILNPPPPDPNNIDVEVNGVDLSQLDPSAPGFNCAIDNGWYYSSPNVVTLCGQACTDFENMATPTADVTYYCSAG